MGKYYAIIGKRGVSIADNWSTAQVLIKKTRNARAKKFDSFEETGDYLMQYLCENCYRYPMQFFLNCIWYIYRE